MGVLFLAGALSAGLLCSGCRDGENVSRPGNGSGIKEDSDTVDLIVNGTMQAKILYDTDDASSMTAAYQINDILKNVTGLPLPYMENVRADETVPDDGGVEILVGETNRAESSQLSNDRRDYGIGVINNKVVLFSAIAEGLDKTVEAFEQIAKQYYDGSSLRLPKDLLIIENLPLPDLGAAKFTLKPGHQYIGYVKTLFEYDVYDGHAIVEGGTFDGTYYYTAMIDHTADPETTYLFKFDLRGNLVAQSPKLALDHANDITYVKKWNALLVSHCKSTDGHYSRYSLVNPDTFAVTKMEDLPNPFFGMGYCEQRDSFASARWEGETIDLWNGDLSHRQSFSVNTPPGTSQGVAADANYLYFVRCNPNSVEVYDWDGNHAFNILLNTLMGEPEHISIVDGVMYIGGNNSTWTGGHFSYVELADVTGNSAADAKTP